MFPELVNRQLVPSLNAVIDPMLLVLKYINCAAGLADGKVPGVYVGIDEI